MDVSYVDGDDSLDSDVSEAVSSGVGAYGADDVCGECMVDYCEE